MSFFSFKYIFELVALEVALDSTKVIDPDLIPVLKLKIILNHMIRDSEV